MHHATWTDVPTLQTYIGADRIQKNKISCCISSILILIICQMLTVFDTLRYDIHAVSINISQQSTTKYTLFYLRCVYYIIPLSISTRDHCPGKDPLIFCKKYLAIFSHYKRLMHAVKHTVNVMYTVFFIEQFCAYLRWDLDISGAAYVLIESLHRTFWYVTLLNIVEISVTVF
jgi:hypothetical protein